MHLPGKNGFAKEGRRYNRENKEKFQEWLELKFRIYDPLARQIFLGGEKKEFVFGETIAKSMLGMQDDPETSLEISMLVVRGIQAAAAVWKEVQFLV